MRIPAKLERDIDETVDGLLLMIGFVDDFSHTVE